VRKNGLNIKRSIREQGRRRMDFYFIPVLLSRTQQLTS
jgi:hypothetical protein